MFRCSPEAASRAKRWRLLALLGALSCLTLNAPRACAQAAERPQAPKQKSVDTLRAESSIRAVLDAQVAAWNAGRLEAFMEGYWRSPELSFFSGGRKLAGWDATLARYRQSYQSEGREMGRLAFSDLDVLVLGRDSAVVRGRWELTLSDGKRPGGLYTLVFSRFKDGWKIIHDHTSSNQ